MVAHGLVEFGGVQVVFGGEDVVFDVDAEPWDVSSVGIRILCNGVEYTDLDLSEDQFSAWSLTKVAFDGQIGTGSITVNGRPGWMAGDRITIYSWSDQDCIFMGYVTDRSISRDPNSPLEFQSTYQLVDVNRRLIGVAYVDQEPGGNPDLLPTLTTDELVSYFLFSASPVPLFTHAETDLTYVGVDGTTMRNRSYTSDGMTDAIGDLILYSGWTFFVTEKMDGQFFIHWHDLLTGPASTISISDIPNAANGTTVFAPINPELLYSAADLQTEVGASNGIVNIGPGSSGTFAFHAAGGLGWQRWYQTSATADDLEVFVNGLLGAGGGGEERTTFRCSISPLSGSQVVQFRQGNIVRTQTDVWGNEELRISSCTITAAIDEGGHPQGVGIWTVALEMSHPIRTPAAAIGYGGQGGFYGALADNIPEFAHFRPVSGGQFIASDIPVGATYRVNFQLVDKLGQGLPIRDVACVFTLNMWADFDRTVVGDGWSIAIPMGGDSTDGAGQVYVDLTHDTTGTSVVIDLNAAL